MLVRSSLLIAGVLLFVCGVWATVFGTVRGIIHDAQHSPIAGAEVMLRAMNSEYTQSAETNNDGDFHFDAVPLGEYTLNVSKAGFAAQEGRITVLSGSA